MRWIGMLLVLTPGLAWGAEVGPEGGGGRWNAYLTPLIVIVVPILVMFLKKVVPDNRKWLIPVMAIVLGGLADTVLALSTSGFVQPGVATGTGLAAIGLREISVQLKKAWTGEGDSA